MVDWEHLRNMLGGTGGFKPFSIAFVDGRVVRVRRRSQGVAMRDFLVICDDDSRRDFRVRMDQVAAIQPESEAGKVA